MITEEDCRRKAAEWLGKAQTASDPKTGASMRRVFEAWNTLAQQIEHSAFPHSPAPVRRPVELARYSSDIDSVHIGDVLRQRLHLSDEPAEEPSA